MRKLRLDELGRVTTEAFRTLPKLPVTVVLDNIRSAHNVGSIFRTADAFAIERIILCGITAQPPHREIHKTAIGATDSVDWEYNESVESAVRRLIQEDYTLVIAEQTDQSIPLQDLAVAKSEKFALILGNEVDGVSDAVLDHASRSVEIPQFGTKHSFNVAVSAGIILWELTRQIRHF